MCKRSRTHICATPERNHDKAFYQLCQHMEPEYLQLEFDLRAYLSYLDAAGAALWVTAN